MSKRVVHKSEERVDPNTGEIVSSKYAVIVDKKSQDKDFVKVFRAFTRTVLRDLEIESGRAKLLFWFIDQIQDMRPNQTQIVIAPVKMISKALTCSDVSIKRWLTHLIKKQYILRHTQPDGTIINNTYVINNKYIIKGVLQDSSTKKPGVHIPVNLPSSRMR